jgi:anti-anti-sigma regulatory factor
MFEFQLSREPEITRLNVSGTIIGDQDFDVLNEAFAFVQPADNLILDLSEVRDVDPSVMMLLHDVLMRRAVLAESVVVSTRPALSMELVLYDVDRVCPIVTNVDLAIDILHRPWAKRRLPH